jgi:hypothetical protein
MGALRRGFLLLLLGASVAPSLACAAGWRPIFNGRNLDGWVPKISGHPLGENWRDTFRVEKGVLKVSYDRYDRFNGEFGHLIYRKPLSSYRLRFEYRFLGPQTPGAPAWAVRNSGVMLHGEPPETMGLNQSFPISVEAQLLGAAPGETRPTGNVCTPGVTVSIGGVPLKDHCRNSASRTYAEGEWVRFEVEVHGSRLVRQIVNGETAMEYADVRLAPDEFARFAPGSSAYAGKGPEPLAAGYISLQGEGHPLEFRKIELLELPD